MISVPTTTTNRRLPTPASMTPQQTRWAAALALPLVAGPAWCLALAPTGHRFGTLAGLVLLAVLTTSAITDFRWHKIYNWATYSAFLWALVINLAATLLATSESRNLLFEAAPMIGPAALGGIGLKECLAGAAACFAFTLVGYHLSSGGAGDVKLAAAIGALLGFQQGLFAVAYSYIVAAVAIMIWSVWANGPTALVKAAARAIGSLLGPLWPFQPSSDDRALLWQPVPLGPYFAIGTMLVVLNVVPS